jgi:predicted enzyme related to lactoylglutathione lyase
MTIRTSSWPSGVPCWADVMATDVRASGSFSTAVLGWTVPEPEEQWGGYVTAEADGQVVAGIGPVQEGARTAWTLYLATDDAEGLVAAAPEHGGTVLGPVRTSTSPTSARRWPPPRGPAVRSSRRRWTRRSAGWRASRTPTARRSWS